METKPQNPSQLLFVNEWFCRHGAPRRIITDRAKYFIQSYLPLISKKLGIEQLASTAYHPQTDGQSESSVKFVSHILAKILDRDHDDWDLKVPLVAFEIRTQVNESSKYTPFMLTYGQEAAFPIDLHLTPTNSPLRRADDKYVNWLFSHLAEV